jgi:hypothetical protein
MSEDAQPEGPIEGAKTSYSEIQQRLQSADTGEKIKIGKMEVDAKEMHRRMEIALATAKEHFQITPDDIYFKSFPGNIVGESSSEGIGIDPVMSLHPIARMIRLLIHELGHDWGRIQNEPLVDLFADALGYEEGGGASEKFEKTKVIFSQFIKTISDGRPAVEVIKEVYHLYYTDQFEKIYELAEAHGQADFFWDVFPELKYQSEGETVPVGFEDIEDELNQPPMIVGLS